MYHPSQTGLRELRRCFSCCPLLRDGGYAIPAKSGNHETLAVRKDGYVSIEHLSARRGGGRVCFRSLQNSSQRPPSECFWATREDAAAYGESAALLRNLASSSARLSSREGKMASNLRHFFFSHLSSSEDTVYLTDGALWQCLGGTSFGVLNRPGVLPSGMQPAPP